jgi:hypothetical protein
MSFMAIVSFMGLMPFVPFVMLAVMLVGVREVGLLEPGERQDEREGSDQFGGGLHGDLRGGVGGTRRRM